MGSVTSSISDAGKGVADRMTENQREAQERVRRVMIAQQMAIARERTWWFGGVTSALGVGLLLGAMKGKNVTLGSIPFIGLSILTAYTWDFGYGTKINRINQMHREIMNSPEYFFYPIEGADKATSSFQETHVVVVKKDS